MCARTAAGARSRRVSRKSSGTGLASSRHRRRSSRRDEPAGGRRRLRALAAGRDCAIWARRRRGGSRAGGARPGSALTWSLRAGNLHPTPCRRPVRLLMSRASWARHERRGASGAVRNGGSGAVRSWSYPFWGLFDTAVLTMPMETRSMRARGRVRSHRKVSRCGLSRHPGTQLRLAAPYRKEVESMNRRIAHAAQIVAFVLALALVPAALAAAGGGPRGGGGSTTSSSALATQSWSPTRARPESPSATP